MASKNNREPVPCPYKLCVSFHCHPWIENRVTIRKCSNHSRIVRFSPRVALKFDEWPWKTIGHLFYVTSSFVRHFKAIGKFKLELQSENAQFGSKLAIFVQCDLEIRQMTLKNIGAPLLYYFKLCVSFQNHQWIQTEVTVRKHSKLRIFVPLDLEIWRMTLTLKIDRTPLLWPFKLWSFRNHQWIQSYGPEMPKMGQNLFWCLWPLTSDLDFCMDITSANGNYTWKFHDDTMRGTLWKGGHRRTDGRTELFLKLLGRS